jgi:hypothetical protein
MNKLSKIQRDRIAAVLVCVPLLMGLLYYFGVMTKQNELAATVRKTADMQDKLRTAEATMGRSEEVADELQARQQLLQRREAMMTPDRDAYAWVIDTINPFIQARNGVNIYSYSQPDVSDVGFIPNFPYRWATFHLKGTGYYHEFGEFFADLENKFPYFRVQNLDMSANSGPGVEPEKLSFSFDIVSPVVPSSTK